MWLVESGAVLPLQWSDIQDPREGEFTLPEDAALIAPIVQFLGTALRDFKEGGVTFVPKGCSGVGQGNADPVDVPQELVVALSERNDV